MSDLRLEIAAIVPVVEEALALQPGNPEILCQLKALRKLATDVNSAMDQQDITRQQYESTDTERLMAVCESGPTVSAHDDYMIVYCGSQAISDTAKIANSQTIVPNS